MALIPRLIRETERLFLSIVIRTGEGIKQPQRHFCLASPVLEGVVQQPLAREKVLQGKTMVTDTTAMETSPIRRIPRCWTRGATSRSS